LPILPLRDPILGHRRSPAWRAPTIVRRRWGGLKERGIRPASC